MLRVVVIGPDKPVYNEADAAEAITPGHLVDLNSSGKAVKSANAGGAAATALPVMVAVENDIYGKGIDDAYATNDRVIYQHLRSGCEFMALVPAAASAIVFNDYLTTAADGVLIKGTAANAVAMARTAVDNSAGATLVRVRALVI